MTAPFSESPIPSDPPPVPVIETVPNFSEGRDPGFVDAVVSAFESSGAEVLDASRDPDHNRSVVTAVGAVSSIEAGALAAAEVALERIDLRHHEGVHPRVGALDVLPFVPLRDVSWHEVVQLSRRVGGVLEQRGIPIHYYGRASDPPGRVLADLRRGGFENLETRHPSAGASCIGVRDVLLAWNVDVIGVDLRGAREIASRIRERDGGFPGLRALGLLLEEQDRVQISMNLEDPIRTAPLQVFEAIEQEVLRRSGEVVETEVIGMVPDVLAGPEVAERIRLKDPGSHRILGLRVDAHVASRRAGVPLRE